MKVVQMDTVKVAEKDKCLVGWKAVLLAGSLVEL